MHLEFRKSVWIKFEFCRAECNIHNFAKNQESKCLCKLMEFQSLDFKRKEILPESIKCETEKKI